MNTNNVTSFNTKKTKSYYFLTAVITLLLIGGLFGLSFFCPNFMFSNSKETFANLLAKNIASTNVGIKIAAILNCISTSVLLLLGIFGGGIFIRYFICSIVYEKWLKTYITEHEKIINSCNPETFNDKVAIVVPTCNDFSPNTILQTAQQTYKKCDVGICDDSSKQEYIDKIQQFANEHGFFVLRRSDEHKKLHPTKAGNLFYFVDKIADRYDFILENDSSSIITQHFVQNALCYFHSPLLKDKKVGGIVCTGHFYGTKNILSRINAIQSQGNEANCFGGVIRLTGHPIYLQGGGTFFSTEALKSIPLEKIECPCCDMARGMYLSLHGYDSFGCPFDFSGKIGVQNMQGGMKQRLKGNGGDVGMFKNHLVNEKYRGIRRNISIRSISWPTVIFIPTAVIAGFIGSITSVILNIVFANPTSLILMLCLFLLVIIAFLLAILINKTSFTSLICVLLLMICEGAIIFRRFGQIFVRSVMFNKGSSGAVTAKTDSKTPIKERLKGCGPRFIGIAVCIALCLTLQFAFPPNIARDPFIIWTNLFTFLALPSILFILVTFVGEINGKVGWTQSITNFNIAPTDYRYKYIKESEVGKKQKEA